MSFLRNVPPSIQRLTVYICCVYGCDLQFSENKDPFGWEEIRIRLSRLPNLASLSFIVQHDEQHISNPMRTDHKVFDARLRARFEKELFLLHEQGILSISSSVVAKFGPQD